MPPEARAARLNARYRHHSATDVLRHALRDPEAGDLALVSSFGAESAVLLHMVSQIRRDVPVLFGGPDLLLQWVKNQYFDYATSSQIDAVAVSTQTFTAH